MFRINWKEVAIVTIVSIIVILAVILLYRYVQYKRALNGITPGYCTDSLCVN